MFCVDEMGARTHACTECMHPCVCQTRQMACMRACVRTSTGPHACKLQTSMCWPCARVSLALACKRTHARTRAQARTYTFTHAHTHTCARRSASWCRTMATGCGCSPMALALSSPPRTAPLAAAAAAATGPASIPPSPGLVGCSEHYRGQLQRPTITTCTFPSLRTEELEPSKPGYLAPQQWQAAACFSCVPRTRLPARAAADRNPSPVPR